MSRSERAAARRYARAVFKLASTQGKNDSRRLRSDLQALGTLVSGNEELRTALEDPRVRSDQRRAVLEAIAKKLQLPALTRGLLALLAEQDDLLILPTLAEAYAEEWNARNGVVAAEATGAVPLTAAQQRNLAAALGRASGGEVELRTRVDPEVIGGLRVKVGDTVYDGSVRARLRALRRSLSGMR